MSNFSELSQALKQTSLKLHPSQAHGLVCGLLCGQLQPNENWMPLITGEKASPKIEEILQKLYHLSHQELQAFAFEFQLLLPNDRTPLPNRAEALTLWCQGFLTGLKFVEIPIVGREPGELTEAIDDLIEIAKLNYDEVATNEEDETAYVELVEYVRMAINLIYQQSHEGTTEVSDAASQKNTH